MARIYFSNIRPAWPLERQRAVLAEHYPDAAGGSEYVDDLPPKKRKKPAAADLVERAEMLKPRGRKQADDIVVASLAPLAVSQIDLVKVLADAEARGSVLVAVAEDVRLTPPYGAAGIAAALEKFAVAIHRGRGNAKLGHEVSAQRRMERAKGACDTFKERW
jgi:DNA invertase Pin-like site-specific DNA recombinase